MLILICGLPRAGKTTYSQSYDNVVHLDNYGSSPISIKYERCARNAKTDSDVVIEGVYSKAEFRKNLIQTYQGTGTRCIWLDTSHEVRQARQGWSRNCDFPFEPPTYAEGWDEIIIVRDGIETKLER